MADDADPAVLGWRRADQLVLGILLIATLVLLGVHWARLSGWGMRPVEVEHLPSREPAFRLDLNTANWVELSQLPGIGPTLARRIVAERNENGRFESVEDLERVRGIGPKTVARLAKLVTSSR